MARGKNGKIIRRRTTMQRKPKPINGSRRRIRFAAYTAQQVFPFSFRGSRNDEVIHDNSNQNGKCDQRSYDYHRPVLIRQRFRYLVGYLGRRDIAFSLDLHTIAVIEVAT